MTRNFPMLVAAMVLLAALLGQTAGPAAPSAPAPSGADRDTLVFFSPQGGCMEAVVEAIDSARQSIRVQAFILSTRKISGPLIEARSRGVDVTVIFDREWSEKELSLDEALAEAGIGVYIDGPEDGSAHNKVMIIDGQVVLTGSFNFTRSADENNAENLLVLRNRPAIIAAYEKNFQARLAVSKKHPMCK